VRYYNIELTQANGKPYLFKSLGGLGLTSLLPTGPQNPQTGQTNPAALQIEFDLPMANLTNPNNNCWLRVWGLGLQDLANSSNLNDLNISIFAGMAKGLPLANPAQAGLIVTGKIFQTFGNWIGTAQTLDLLIIAGGNGGNLGSQDSPGNYPFQWLPGTPLSTAIAQTLRVGLPGLAQSINISSQLSTNHVQSGHYTSVTAFVEAVSEMASGILGASYAGITSAINGTTITVYDGTVAQTKVTQIAFQDLLGQPTFIDPGTISVKTVLRSDINIGDMVTLPPSLTTTTAGALLRFQDKTSFSGKYQVQQIQHFGNFRQPDAESWNTTFQMSPVNN
jgi:hypothetical protein